jgi:transcriptional regulator with XRE-family HTH domain
MIRAQFASLFWAAIMEKRKRGKFPLSELAKLLGKNKGEVSRWFSGNAPNWTVGTIAEVAYALNLEIRIEAIDRDTGMVLTESGPKESSPPLRRASLPPDPHSPFPPTVAILRFGLARSPDSGAPALSWKISSSNSSTG